jgi:hypothetical protein
MRGSMRVIVETGQSGWQVAGAIAGIVAALATAVAAWAAWKAASASERTSHESRHALAVALRPNVRAQVGDPETVDGGNGTRLVVVVQNVTEWDATDVEVEVSYRDGETIRDSTERLGSRIRDTDEGRRIRLRVEPKDRHPYEALSRLTVRWSDAQRISRYELRQDFSFEPSTQTVSMEERVEQISGP